jgi:RNA polymerase sigma factor (sigma-70 family)
VGEVSRPVCNGTGDRSRIRGVPSRSDDEKILALLRTLPAGMRAAVVLRYVEGLSVSETAAAMRCSEGNVKSQSARGLERLREFFRAHQPNLI